MNISFRYARMALVANWILLAVLQVLPDPFHHWMGRGLILTGAAVLSLATRCPVGDELAGLRRKKRLVDLSAGFLLVVILLEVLLGPAAQ